MLDKTFDAARVEPRIAETWDAANAFAAGAGVSAPDADAEQGADDGEGQ